MEPFIPKCNSAKPPCKAQCNYKPPSEHCQKSVSAYIVQHGYGLEKCFYACSSGRAWVGKVFLYMLFRATVVLKSVSAYIVHGNRGFEKCFYICSSGRTWVGKVFLYMLFRMNMVLKSVSIYFVQDNYGLERIFH